VDADGLVGCALTVTLPDDEETQPDALVTVKV